MNVTQSQFRNLYAIFTVVFIINVGYTILNFHESRKLRRIQHQIAEEQLNEIKKGKKKEKTPE
jgi:hypothetical protein